MLHMHRVLLLLLDTESRLPTSLTKHMLNLPLVLLLLLNPISLPQKISKQKNPPNEPLLLLRRFLGWICRVLLTWAKLIQATFPQASWHRLIDP